MRLECWVVCIGDLQLLRVISHFLLLCALIRVILQFCTGSPNSCSLSATIKAWAPRFIYKDVEVVMRPSLSTSRALSRCS